MYLELSDLNNEPILFDIDSIERIEVGSREANCLTTIWTCSGDDIGVLEAYDGIKEMLQKIAYEYQIISGRE